MKRRINLTYPEIAERLGVTLCAQTDLCRSSALDHERGEYGRGKVHWRDRRVTKPGLYRFLKLVVLAKHPDVDQQASWVRSYLVHQQINNYADILRIRIPFNLTIEDRLRVKANILSVPRREPFRREAFQWARRRS